MAGLPAAHRRRPARPRRGGEVGATAQLAARTATADQVVKSVCPYCAVGCGQNVYVKDEKVIQIEGDPDSPISRGRLCPKGSASLQLTTGPARGSTRCSTAGRTAPTGRPLDLDTAMDMIADRVIAAARERLAVGGRGRRPGPAHAGHRQPGRRDARQRGELPHQEAVHRARRDPDREPGPDLTLRHRPRSGDIVRARRRHHVPAGPAERRLHRDRGLQHGRVPPGRLPVGDGGQGARGQGHPRRPAVHPDQRGRRPARAAPGRPDIAFLGGLINYVLTSDKYFREYVRRLHQRADDHRRGLRRHRGPRRAVLRLRPRERTYDTATWQYEGRRRRRPRASATTAARRQLEPRCAQAAEARRTAPAAPHVGRADDRTRPCSTRAACSRSSSGTSPATPRRWSSRSAACPQDAFRQVVRAAHRQLRPRAHDGASSTPSAGPSTPSASQYIRAGVDPADAARQHRPARRRDPGAARPRHHPGLDRHPDAVQPAARLHPDAARARATRTSTRSSRPSGTDKGFWGNMRAYMVSLLKAWWGDAATADNDFCFDYLPRLTGGHCTYDTVMAQLAGRVQGLLPPRREPGRRLGQRQAAAARHGQPRLAGGARLLADRERHLVEGRARRSRPASCAPRTSAPRCSSCPPPRTPRRTAASPTPSGCCSGTTRRSSRPATRAATCGSSTTWAGSSGRSWPARADAMDRPVLDLTWDYPTEGPPRRARRRGGAGRDQRLGRRRQAAVGLHRS